MKDIALLISVVTLCVVLVGILFVAIYKMGRKDEYDEWIDGTKSNDEDDGGGSDTDTSEAWKNTK